MNAVLLLDVSIKNHFSYLVTLMVLCKFIFLYTKNYNISYDFGNKYEKII